MEAAVLSAKREKLRREVATSEKERSPSRKKGAPPGTENKNHKAL